MVGRIGIKEKRTSKIRYVFYSSLSETLLAPLWKNDEFALWCDCNPLEKIELKVGKREVGKKQYTYYLYNAKQGMTERHNPRCRKFSHYMGKSEYEAGWKDEDGFFAATLCDDVFAIGEKNTLVAAPSTHSYEPRAKTCVNPTTQKGEVTLLGLVTKLNLITWEKSAKNGSLPESMRKFLDKVYGTMKTIKLTNKRIDSLQAINYDYKKTGEMKPKKSFMFVYMRFLKVTDDPYKSERVKVHCQNTFGNEVYFFVAKAKFRKVYENVRFENKEKQILFVGGFVYKTSEKSSLLTFSSLCLFVTTTLGLYCESSYELEAYDKLCAAHRLFYKPYYSLSEYGDKRPDLLFLDTHLPVLGEIFGFNSQDYLEERACKLQLAHELQDHYGFWKWDAYAKEPFPAFPPVGRNLPHRVVLQDPMMDAESEVAASSDRQEQVRLKQAPTKEQIRELEQEFSRQLEEAGYVKVSDASSEKKDSPK